MSCSAVVRAREYLARGLSQECLFVGIALWIVRRPPRAPTPTASPVARGVFTSKRFSRFILALEAGNSGKHGRELPA